MIVELEDDRVAALRIVDEHDRRSVHRRGDEIDVAVIVDVDRGRGRRDQIILEAEFDGLLVELPLAGVAVEDLRRRHFVRHPGAVDDQHVLEAVIVDVDDLDVPAPAADLEPLLDRALVVAAVVLRHQQHVAAQDLRNDSAISCAVGSRIGRKWISHNCCARS